MATSVYTVGYQGRTVDNLLETLLDAGVARLVDVREVPFSRKPGFSKADLGGALAGVGIEYSHVRALGNPKENRERYRSGDVDAGAEIYRRHLHERGRDALADLARSLPGAPICLLCFERDHSVCHRDAVVDGLRELCPDLRAVHL